MMRSLFSGVAGLTTHQTRMDVIGNNIANVNTTAYKSQSMVFNDLLYQTTQAASGANANTGRGGINPRQIGLGAKTGAISTAISTQGSAQSTNNPWDVMIEGDSFFVVSDGSQNFFTRDGSFTVDGAGNLVMASLGYTVMGWQVDPQTGDIRSDVVSALQIMNTDNLTAPPEATTKAYLSGILDKTDPSINSDAGAVRTFTIYDAQGYSYMVKMSFHGIGSEDNFRVQLDDILDGTGVSLVKKYGLESISQIATFGADGDADKTSVYSADDDATFDGTDTFNVKVAFSEILKGYAQNSLVVAAQSNGKLEVTDPAVGDSVDVGDTVTLKGEVTLSKEQLQAEPYSLIYDDGTKKYYKDKNGIVGEEVTDMKGYLEDLQKSQGVLPGVTISTADIDPNGEDGDYKIAFTAEFEATMKATHTDASFGLALKMPDDEKAILKYVYNLEDSENKEYNISYIAPNGSAQITETQHTRGMEIMFDHDSGKFVGIGGVGNDTATLTFNSSTSSISGEIIDLSQFSNVDIDFSSANNYGNGKKCTLEFTPGSKDSTATGKGRKIGELIGVEIGQDGKITASYDNGLTKLLGQIAVAEFANASGLAKAGNNLYSATQNSGEFDGVGKDITASGGSMTSGVLEMSNVDLSSEFTTMITTQRGFQANSRIITVSDTLLEELVNLKR